jgi:hypothetical protein
VKPLLNLTGEFYLPADMAILDDVQEVLGLDAPLDLSDEAAVVAVLAGYADIPDLIVLLADAAAVPRVRRALPRAEIVTL